MDAIADLQTELICQYDQSLRLTYVNRAYSEWLGLPKDHLLGTGFMDRIPLGERSEVRSHIKSLTAEYPVAISTHQTVLSDGSRVTIEWTDRALFDDKGNVSGYLGVGRNVTFREHQAEQILALKNQLTTILDTMQDAIMSFSVNDRKLLYASASVEQVLGYPIQKFEAEPEFFKKILHPDDLELVMEARNKALQDGYTDVESRIILPDGQIHWLNRRAWVNYDNQGHPVSVLDISRDITDRKRAEQDLQQNERRLRSILEHMQDAVWSAEIPGFQITYANPAIQTIFGRSEADFYQDNTLWMKIMYPEDTPRLGQIHNQVLEEGYRDVEYRIVRPDGEVRWLRDRAWLVKDEKGQPVRLDGIATDITERKQFEEALGTSEEKYRSLVESTEAAITLTDAGGNCLFVNKVAAAPYGVSPEELVGKNISELFPATEVGQGMSENNQVITTGQGKTLEVQVTLAGKPNWFRTNLQPVRDEAGKTYATLAYAYNITEEKKIQQAILAQNEILRQSKDLIILADLQGSITFVNQAGVEILGGTQPEQFNGRPVADFYPPEEALKSLNEYVPQALSTGRWRGETCLKTLNGRLVQVEQTIFPIVDNQSNIVQMATLISDITERKRAEEKIRASEEKYRSLIESTDAAISMTTRNGDYLYLNQIAANPFGVTPEQLVGKNIRDLFPPDGAEHIMTDVERIIAENKGQTIEVQVTLGSSKKWMRVSTQPVLDGSGQPYAAMFFAIDITERKEAELASLWQNELLRQSGDFIGMANEKGVVTFINQGAATLIGADNPQSLIGTSIAQFHSPEGIALIRDKALPYALTHGQWRGENQLKTLDGRLIDVEQQVFPVRDKQGNIVQMATIMTDITERKRAENTLRVSEKRYRQMFEVNGLPKLIVDPADGQLVDVNPAAVKYYGYDLPVLKTMKIYGINQSPPEEINARMTSAIANRLIAFQCQHRLADGSLREVEVYSGPIEYEGRQLLYSTITDITERERAKAALEEANRTLEQRVAERTAELEKVNNRLEAIFSHSGDAIVLLDVTQGIQQANFAFEQLTNTQAAGYPGQSFQTFLQPKNAPAITVALQKVATTLQKQEVEAQTLTGIEVEISLAPVNLSNSAVTNVVGIIRDVTERKQAEEELQALSRRLQLATEAGKIGIWDWDLAKDKLYWDDQMLAFYGLTREELTGTATDYWKQIHPEDYSQLQEAIALANEGIKPFDTEFRIIDKENRITHLKGRAQVRRDETGKAVQIIGVNWDITPLKQAENALKQALEKEKELGELKTRFISMASHEFRTPLASILATTEAMINYRDRMDSNQITTRLDKIRQQVLHLKEIMDDVLQQARFQAGRVEFKPLLGDLDAFCRDIIEEFEHQPGNQGRLTYECPSSPITTSYDQHLMRQIISNLISNALKYSPAEKPVTITLSDDDKHLVFQVRDQGIGIPAEDLAHLFESFHRAGNVGTISGTGLGLNITRQAVLLHGGSITAESEPAQGTIFTVTLPLNRLE